MIYFACWNATLENRPRIPVFTYLLMRHENLNVYNISTQNCIYRGGSININALNWKQSKCPATGEWIKNYDISGRAEEDRC